MSLIRDSRGVTGWIALVCGAITSGAGALFIVQWALGADALTAAGNTYSPMPPSAAVLFAALGSAMLARELWPANRAIPRAVIGIALFSVMVGSMTLVGFVTGLNIDDSLLRPTWMPGAMPIGRMSPVTAFCFFLAGVSLLLLECEARRWAAAPGTLITLAGVVSLMDYWFGAPLIYGGIMIPGALPTSLAVMALGAGLTAAAGSDAWPLNSLIGPSTRARLLRALLPAVVLLALLDDWITVKLLEHSAPRIVLVSALTAISFLLLVSYVITRISGTIGDAVDRAQAERQRAEEALKNSNVLLNEMGRIAAVGGWEFAATMPDQAGGDLKQVWTDEVYRIHEVDRNYGPTVSKGLEFYAPASRPIIERAVRNAIAEGRPFDVELEFITANGNQRWVHAVGRVDRERGKVLGIFQDVTERKRIEEALRKSEERLRNALAERERLSRDLHDDIVQSIYAIGLGLEEIKRLVTVDAHEAKKKLLESISGLNAVIRNLRDHITGQAPDGLDRRRLRGELGALVKMANSTRGMQFDLEANPIALSRLPPTAAYDLINIVREAVSNSLRHSGGKHGAVSLTLRDGAVRLAITDDGVGFDMLELDGLGRGLPNIAARAGELAAQLDIRSGRGQGTCIVVDIPMERMHGDG